MWIKRIFQRKSLETLLAELAGEHRLRRVLGPVSLTALGVGAIIGAGIFVLTGLAAHDKAGPGLILSFVVAGIGCALAALCYAEFASMVPVAGSAYTYAYATLGELFAWIIGWDLVLEYAMSCGVLAADWTKYLNVLLRVLTNDKWQVPPFLSSDPFSTPGAWFSLPAVLVMATITIVLVIGIRESATMNVLLVMTKVGVLLFVIGVGCRYVNARNWTGIPPAERKFTDVSDLLERRPDIARLVAAQNYKDWNGKNLLDKYPRVATVLAEWVQAEIKKTPNVELLQEEHPGLARFLPAKNFGTVNGEELFKKWPDLAEEITKNVETEISKLPSQEEKWGMIGLVGLNRPLESFDDKVRSPFMPFGISGIMVAAAAVFFAYIGFDSISTHSEEAKKPQRDVPIGILSSLVICTVLYFSVTAVITGMEPYPVIDPEAAVAEAY